MINPAVDFRVPMGSLLSVKATATPRISMVEIFPYQLHLQKFWGNGLPEMRELPRKFRLSLSINIRGKCFFFRDFGE